MITYTLLTFQIIIIKLCFFSVKDSKPCISTHPLSLSLTHIHACTTSF